MTNDSLSDLLTRIKNGYLARNDTVEAPYSKLKQAVLKVLEDYGYVQNTQKTADGKTLTIGLVYEKGVPALTEIKRISTPGRRQYADMGALKKIENPLGFYIISTSKGIKTHIEAQKQRMGGELLCFVW